ncbi:MAG: DUF885 domain-containing protein, partial [Chloroflexi bacterium]|nr:DUF885 domain-containing protein [Chloroflexota bacterium]
MMVLPDVGAGPGMRVPSAYYGGHLGVGRRGRDPRLRRRAARRGAHAALELPRARRGRAAPAPRRRRAPQPELAARLRHPRPPLRALPRHHRGRRPRARGTAPRRVADPADLGLAQPRRRTQRHRGARARVRRRYAGRALGAAAGSSRAGAPGRYADGPNRRTARWSRPMADAPSTLSPVFRLAHDYVDRVAELNPIAATSMGVPGHEEELPDLSPAGAQARIVHARETLAALRALTVAGERDRVAAEVMRERLELALELHETRDYLREVRVLGSPISAVRSVFDQMPRDSEEAWERIARRMQRIPEALAGARASLQTGLAEGVRAAQRQAREVARQARVWSGVAE